MKKRVFIVHGWGADPEYGGFPWLKQKLEEKNFDVIVPIMPDTNYPKIKNWVDHIAKSVDIPDKNTYLVGHSIGVQAILRYLETLNTVIGGAVFLAGWFNLTEETYVDDGDREIAKPWLENQIDYDKVKFNSKKMIAIFSDNDPYVPVSNSELFKERLGAEIIIEHNKKHFGCEEGAKDLPSTLESVLKITG